MYDDNSKRPLLYGHGARKGQIFGVHEVLRNKGHGYTTTTNNFTEMEILRSRVLGVTKENEKIKKDNQELRAKIDQTNQLLLQTLEAVRSGKVSDEVFNSIHSVLRKPNFEVPQVGSGENRDNISNDDLLSSSPPR